MDEPEDFDESETKEDSAEFDPNKIEHSEDDEAGDFGVASNKEQADDEYETASPDSKIEVEPKFKEQEESEAEAEQKSDASKEDMVASEEREIRKIIEEGEKAAKEAAPVPPKYEGTSLPDNRGNESGGTWKWFLAGIGIVVIAGVLFMGYQYINVPQINDLQHTGPLAKFEPSEFLAGWKLSSKYLTLADIPNDKKKDLLSEGNLTDVATWEFTKGESTVYIWIKQFSDSKAAKNAAESFSGINWQQNELSSLSFGDESKIGLYKTKGQDPLTAFVRQDNMILTAAYYNIKNQIYNGTTKMQDKAFLTGLTKNIMNDILSDRGESLNPIDVNLSF